MTVADFFMLEAKFVFLDPPVPVGVLDLAPVRVVPGVGVEDRPNALTNGFFPLDLVGADFFFKSRGSLYDSLL